MQDIIEKAKKTHILSKNEIVKLLKSNSEDLFNAADEVRKNFVGDEIHLRALIEFSNICKNNCHYCGLRAENTNVERYVLSKDEIIKLAKNAVDMGFRTIVMQSGESKVFSADTLADILLEIKKLNPTPAITLSIGELTTEEYKILKKAGADRFLLRIETTDKELYKKYHPNMDFENRARCLKDLKELGYEVGTGCLVGLPEQTLESLADDILFFKEINADMIGIGPFIPHKDTPLKDAEGGSFELALKVMAITRLLLPDINIPATTAMEALKENGRIIALQSGANVVMPNITLDDVRKKYEIYPGKTSVTYDNLENKLQQIGRIISKDCGFRGDSPLTLNPSPLGRGKHPRKIKQARYLRKNMTPQERKLWNTIRNNQINNLKFKRQHPIGEYIVDFICIEKRLILEIDGGQHNYKKNIIYDNERTKYLNSRGFQVLRFWNNDIDNNLEGIIEKILSV